MQSNCLPPKGGSFIFFSVSKYAAIHPTTKVIGFLAEALNLEGNDFIEFTAEKAGEFDWYCSNMCGKGHMEMKGKLIVKQ